MGHPEVGLALLQHEAVVGLSLRGLLVEVSAAPRSPLASVRIAWPVTTQLRSLGSFRSIPRREAVCFPSSPATDEDPQRGGKVTAAQGGAASSDLFKFVDQRDRYFRAQLSDERCNSTLAPSRASANVDSLARPPTVVITTAGEARMVPAGDEVEFPEAEGTRLIETGILEALQALLHPSLRQGGEGEVLDTSRRPFTTFWKKPSR